MESWKFLPTFLILPLKHIFSATPFLSPFLNIKAIVRQQNYKTQHGYIEYIYSFTLA